MKKTIQFIYMYRALEGEMNLGEQKEACIFAGQRGLAGLWEGLVVHYSETVRGKVREQQNIGR